MKTSSASRPIPSRRALALAAMLALSACPVHAAEVRPATAHDGPASLRPAPAARPLVQVALLLDTSNSMDGLISQAKSQLWKIVNEFNAARRAGQVPIVQVALYEYGNTRLSATSGWVRQVLPFTTDLDRVSEELFRLSTSGGDEYCGWVIRDAVRDLQWSGDGNDYKAIFIAGNEPFTQGPVGYVDACRGAIRRGIVVNTIHCGPEPDGRSGQWADGAKLAEGRFMTINQDAVVAHVAAPQDDRIATLGVELNRTYVAYGDPAAAQASQSRQQVQDTAANANRQAGSAVQRALTKASSNYRNSGWDLVDACRDGTRVEEVPEAQLPAELRGLTAAGKRAYVAAKAAERKRIQEEIAALDRERTRWLAANRPASPAEATLDRAIADVVRSQAATRNFEFVNTP